VEIHPTLVHRECGRTSTFAGITRGFSPDQPSKIVSRSTREPRKLDFHLINPAATPSNGKSTPTKPFYQRSSCQQPAFGKICGRGGGGEGGCAPCRRPGSPTGTRRAARPLRRPEAAGCRAPNRSRDGPHPEALFLEESLFFNGARRYPASGWRAFGMNRSKRFAGSGPQSGA
jgi:hypothetical protein